MAQGDSNQLLINNNDVGLISPVSIEQLCSVASNAFQTHYQTTPSVCGIAPGRVNLIGDHVDYCDGLVLPMCVPLYTVVVGSKSSSNVARVVTTAVDGSSCVEIDLQCKLARASDKTAAWSNYVRGVMALYLDCHGLATASSGFDCAIVSSVPLGAGLSSSASLQGAMFTFLQSVWPAKSISSHEKAKACQRSEHEYAGVPCGIMDQMATFFGKEGYASLIDCRSLDVTSIPLPHDLTILIVDSRVKHSLASTSCAYAERRGSCEDAAVKYGVKALRDLTLEELERVTLQPSPARRVRHVVSEIDRVRQAGVAMQAGDVARLGMLMNESHDSLRDDFEVSCAELDRIVEIARSQPNVVGARLTGAGFGGCVVVAMKKEGDSVTKLVDDLLASCDPKPRMYVVGAVDGARTVEM